MGWPWNKKGKAVEYLGTFEIIQDEDKGPIIVCDEEKADLLEGAFIDFCHRGYFQPEKITEGGRLSWKLTPWGEKHIKDIFKVKGKD